MAGPAWDVAQEGGSDIQFGLSDGIPGPLSMSL